MDKAQALNSFWNSFELTAYDELTVPDDAVLPYITYETKTDSFENRLLLSASVWYRSTSWAEAEKKVAQIAEYIVKQDPCTILIDGGRIYITKDTPWGTRMVDATDNGVRRILMNIGIEYLTET